jgi:hypothetical protein
MTGLRTLGVAALAFVISTPIALGQTSGGGGVSGGIRGAVASELIRASEETRTGAKAGVVSEATRAAINRETQARAQYETAADYQKAQHSDFNAARSDVLAQVGKAASKSGVEAVIKKLGKPVVGITFPAGGSQLTEANAVSAVSPDKEAYGVLVVIKAARTRQDVTRRLKHGLELNFLNDINYDEPNDAKGAILITGTGKGKKSGVDVVFVTGVFVSGDDAVAITFIADSKIEDYYKETVRGICQAIRRADDFPQ